MTTLRQTIQTAPAKASELITKLSNTSNQALKTRESLLKALSDELTLYVELEEKHLLPLLRKQPETKELAVDAAKGNKELRARLSELAKLPKDDEAFIPKLAELKKGFQQHVRDERQELLPAVVKALGDEEASEVADRIQDGIADAENATREARRKEKEAAERQAERAARRAQTEAERAAAEAAEEILDTLTVGVVSAQEGVRQMTETLAERTQDTAVSLAEAADVYSGTVQQTVQGLAAVAASSSAATKAVSEIGSIWTDWLGDAARVNMDVAQQLLACRDVRQVAETQRDFVITMMSSWMERNRRLFDVAQRSSREALRPLNARLAEQP